ncbi:unnamed protein product, partial [Didymodactylos carnosus]
FPSSSAVQLLIDSGGIDVNAVDSRKNSPLHLIASYDQIIENTDERFLTIQLIIKLFNDTGCHWDLPNEDGNTPIQCAHSDIIKIFMKSRQRLSLKCLMAKMIKNSEIDYYQHLPERLCIFVELH